MVDDRNKVNAGNLVFIVVYDGTFKKWIGEVQEDDEGLYVEVNGDREYIEDVDEVRIIHNEEEGFRLMQPHHCNNCEYAKKITFPPNLLIAVKIGQIAFRPPNRPRDGVLCASEEKAKEVNAIEDFKREGYVRMWRIEIMDGETAECDCWKQLEINPRLKSIVDAV